MGLFHRRPKPVKVHDCRYREAWHSARYRARGLRARLAAVEEDRADLRAEHDAAMSLASGYEAAMRISQPVGAIGDTWQQLAGRVREAEHRAAAATQRAGLAERRAARLEELLARAEGRPHAVPEPA